VLTIVSTDVPDIVLLQNTTLAQLDTAVKSSLATTLEHDGIWELLLNNPLDKLWLDRKEIELVGASFRGLNGGDIRIDQQAFDAFFAQSFDRLGAPAWPILSPPDPRMRTLEGR
jgi:hypothetical protein